MKYRILFILSILLFEIDYSNAQIKSFFIDVNIIDVQSGIPVSKPLVFISQIGKEIQVDRSGKFSIAVPPGKYLLQISQFNYEEKTELIVVNRDTLITILMTPKLRYYLINEVTVTANRIDKIRDVQPGMERIDNITVSSIPTLGGEKDAVKILQSLPGVKAESEGSSEMIVRGGSSDQNLFLLDNAILYNSEHLFGFLSAYNPSTIGKVDLYKGGFPSEFGGRLSSIIDGSTKSPNLNNFLGEYSLGTLSTRIGMHIPIVKNKSAFFISGRRTYFDLLLYPFQNQNNYESFNFYDVNIKYLQKFKNFDLTVLLYSDRDKHYDVFKPAENKEIKDELNLYKKNRIAAAQIKSNIGNVKNDLSLAYVKYSLNILDLHERPDSLERNSSDFSSLIEDFSVSDKASFQVTHNLMNVTGIAYTIHFFHPAAFNLSDYRLDTTISRVNSSNLQELNLFSEFSYTIKGRNELRCGFRNSNYFIEQKGYSYIEPRIAYKHEILPNLSMKFSYSFMTQPLHLLSNPGLGLPLDIWVPADEILIPEKAHQFSIGGFLSTSISQKEIVISIEGYYKSMKNIITYRDGYSSHNFTSLSKIPVQNVSNALTIGDGVSYGLESMIEKRTGDLKGWISYTLSCTKHHFPDLNDGIPFFPRYDSRHNISVVGYYAFSKKWTLSMNWSYYTGQAITIPVSAYYAPDFIFTNGSVSTQGNEYLLYKQSERNVYRMKDFHSLSVDAKRDFLFKRCKGSLEFGVYNLYNRRNPYYYYFDLVYNGQDENGHFQYTPSLKSVSVFPIMPYCSFTWKF